MLILWGERINVDASFEQIIIMGGSATANCIRRFRIELIPTLAYRIRKLSAAIGRLSAEVFDKQGTAGG